jgi:hypothetical protein
VRRAEVSFWNGCAAFALLLRGASRPNGDWNRDFRGEIMNDGNLSNSNRDADQRKDFALKGHSRFGRFGELTDRLRRTFHGRILWRWRTLGGWSILLAGQALTQSVSVSVRDE